MLPYVKYKKHTKTQRAELQWVSFFLQVQNKMESIDDLLEIGMLQKLETHLQTIQRETVRKMVPEDEHETLENFLTLRHEYKLEVAEQ